MNPSIQPKPSSTVIIKRSGDGIPSQVYLLKRSSNSTFMPGNFVFPGGVLEPSDRDVDFWINYIDLSLDEIRRRFNREIEPESALAHYIAAVRETYEESGILFLKTIPAINKSKTMTHLNKLRQKNALPIGWLNQHVRDNQWTLSLDSMIPWSHWITPMQMKLRYSTWFFIAELPDGQSCRPDNHETEQGIWVHPKEGLRNNIKGLLPLSPPTLVTLHELMITFALDDPDGALKQRTWKKAIMPRKISTEEATLILEPWDPEYADNTVRIDAGELSALLLGIGEPFSRLWYQNGVWKPVGLKHD